MYYQQALTSARKQRTRRIKRNGQLGSYTASKQMGPVTSTLFLAIIIGVLALLYLTQITKTSVYGYQINELSEQQTVLLQEQQELRVEASRLQSVARIEDSSAVAGLEPESNVTYDNR